MAKYELKRIDGAHAEEFAFDSVEELMSKIEELSVQDEVAKEPEVKAEAPAETSEKPEAEAEGSEEVADEGEAKEASEEADEEAKA